MTDMEVVELNPRCIEGDSFFGVFEEGEQADFWDDFDNLQKAKIIR